MCIRDRFFVTLERISGDGVVSLHVRALERISGCVISLRVGTFERISGRYSCATHAHRVRAPYGGELALWLYGGFALWNITLIVAVWNFMFTGAALHCLVELSCTGAALICFVAPVIGSVPWDIIIIAALVEIVVHVTDIASCGVCFLCVKCGVVLRLVAVAVD